MTPKVTVFMPVYNREKYLKETIESILNQTFQDFEFLIIDDGSTDKSVDIIKSYIDSRIKLVINETNLKIPKTRNKGLELAIGEYIALMDSDDISVSNRLQKQVEFMDKHPEIGACGSWIKLFESDSMVIKYPKNTEEIKANMLFNNSIANPSTIIRKSFINKYNLSYNINYICSEDYDFWTRCLKYFPIENLQEILLLYRVHKKQTSTICLKEMNNFDIEILKNLLSNLGIVPTEEEKNLHKSILNRTYNYSEIHLKDIESWFLKLITQNKLTQYCNEMSFQNTIESKWLIICKDLAKHGVKSYKIYKKSELTTKFMLKEELKFLIIGLLEKIGYYK